MASSQGIKPHLEITFYRNRGGLMVFKRFGREHKNAEERKS